MTIRIPDLHTRTVHPVILARTGDSVRVGDHYFDPTEFADAVAAEYNAQLVPNDAIVIPRGSDEAMVEALTSAFVAEHFDDEDDWSVVASRMYLAGVRIEVTK